MKRSVDVDAVERYLAIISQGAQEFTFQTFDDKGRHDGKHPEVLNGTFAEAVDELVEHNSWGAGVFVTVNETDLKGHNSANLIKPRAVWIEADTGLPTGLPLSPSVTVETSPGRFQLIFAVSDLDWTHFDGIMRRLVADYGCDSNAADRARVLRLPGFWHQKALPFFVRIVEEQTSEIIYTSREVRDAFSPIDAPRKRLRERPGTSWSGSQDDYQRVLKALVSIDRACRASSGPITLKTEGHDDETIDWSDRKWWLTVGFCLHDYFKGSDVGYSLWIAASNGDQALRLEGCPSKFDEADQRRAWEGFSTPRAAAAQPQRWRTIATIFWAARACGAKLVGRPRRLSQERVMHASGQKVVEAGRLAIDNGLQATLAAHASKAHTRYSGKMSMLVDLLLEGIDPSNGFAQMPPLQTLAQALGTSEGTVQSYVKRLAAEGTIVKSNGAGLGIKGKGVVYAFNPRILAACGADSSDTASITSSEDYPFPVPYTADQKTLLHAEGGNGIEPWVELGLLPPPIVDRISEAIRLQRGRAAIKRIALELWYWHNQGMERHDVMRAILEIESDFRAIAARRARDAGRLNGWTSLDLADLTACQFLSALLRAMGRYSTRKGLCSPEAGRIAMGKAQYAAAQKAAQEQRNREYAYAYWIERDPDFATVLDDPTSKEKRSSVGASIE